MMDHFEILIRSILIRPDKPAVLLLGHFSPQTHQTHDFAGPDHWHNIVVNSTTSHTSPSNLPSSPTTCGIPSLSRGTLSIPSSPVLRGMNSSRRCSWRTSRARNVRLGAWPGGRRTKLSQRTPQGLKQAQAMPMDYSAALVSAPESLSQKRIQQPTLL